MSIKTGWCITGDHKGCPGTVVRRVDSAPEPCSCETCGHPAVSP